MTPPALGAWWALTDRALRASWRSGDIVFAALSPVLFFVCFLTPLRERIDAAGMDYAEYLVPVIVLQAAFFTAIVAVETVGEDSAGGLDRRLAVQPIPAGLPVLARLAASGVRLSVSIGAALAVAALYGTRFRGGPADAVAALLLVLGVGTALCLFADALGSRVRDASGAVQILLLPQLVLVMVSTGMMPAAGFPDWIRPFVENQPVSVIAATLRSYAAGVGGGQDLAAALRWVGGALLLAALTATGSRRALARRGGRR